MCTAYHVHTGMYVQCGNAFLRMTFAPDVSGAVAVLKVESASTLLFNEKEKHQDFFIVTPVTKRSC